MAKKTNVEKAFVFLWHDDVSLHVCVVMEDNDVKNTAAAKNDAPHTKGDVTELFFQPADDAYSELHLAPNLATLEFAFPRALAFVDDTLGKAYFFDSGMQCQAGEFTLPSGTSGWWGYMKIPFKKIGSSADKLAKAKFAVCRLNYSAAWGKKPEASTICTIRDGRHLHRPDRWLVFE